MLKLVEKPLDKRPAPVEKHDCGKSELDIPAVWHIDLSLYPEKGLEHRRENENGNGQNQRYPEPALKVFCHAGMVASVVSVAFMVAPMLLMGMAFLGFLIYLLL